MLMVLQAAGRGETAGHALSCIEWMLLVGIWLAVRDMIHKLHLEHIIDRLTGHAV